MKYVIYIVLLVFAASCTKDTFVDTGKPLAVHNTSMMEYFKTSSYNWDTVRLIIERADLVDMFEGNDTEAPQITFFGLTNHSLRRWMLTQKEETDYSQWPFQVTIIKPIYDKVSDIPEDICRELILSHVYKGRLTVDKIPLGIISFDPDTYESIYKEGMNISLMAGNQIWLGLIPSEEQGIPDAGYRKLLLAKENGWQIDEVVVASKNIQTNNGVVHSLEYGYDAVKLTDDIK